MTIESTASEAQRPQNWLAGLLLKGNAAWLARYVAFRQRLRKLSRGRKRWIARRAAVTVTGAALLLALSSSPASAATITVQNNVNINDNGVCSLREAIENANDTTDGQPHDDCAAGNPAGADTINLPNSGSFTIQNVQGTYFDTDTGLPLITSEITIEANNSIIRRANGAPDFRLFTVAEYASLTINDADLRNGMANDLGAHLSAGQGGAILSYYGTLNLTNVTVQNNEAQNSGGGILQYGGTTTLDGCTISGNTAGMDGGGLAARQSDGTSVTGSDISNNMAGVGGGGVSFFDGSGGVIDNSSINDNTAGGGGGLEAYGHPVVVNNSTISGNSAVGDGGGVTMSYGGSVTLDNTIVNDNMAGDDGGGIYAGYDSNGLTAQDSAISGNSAGGHGGGIYAYDSPVNLTATAVDGNESADIGGGIYTLQNTLTLSGSTVSGNESGSRGGGIYTHFTEVTLQQGSELSDNYSANNGGGLFNEGSNTTIDDTVISGNTAALSGGGILDYVAHLAISNSTISGNSAGASGGGLQNSDSTVSINNSLIEGNSAVESGGGLRSYQGSTLTIEDSVLSSNDAQRGGGLHIENSELTLERSTIDGNISTSFGGGFYIAFSDSAYGYGPEVFINRSTISNNTAGSSGGGIDVYYDAEVELVNSTVSGNHSASHGGGIANYYGQVSLQNVTVSDNTADVHGGGLSNDAGDMELNGSLISGNASPTGREAYNGIGGGLASTGFNVFGYNNDDGLYNFVPGGFADTTPAAGVYVADILQPLGNNGGPTETQALPPGSPAIDIMSSGLCFLTAVDGVDQRGFVRNADGDGVESPFDCDSGAFEAESYSAESLCPAGEFGQEVTTIIGTGMGSPDHMYKVSKVSVPDSADLTALYGQMAALNDGPVRFVRFIYPDKSYEQVKAGALDAGQAFDEGADQAISWWGAALDPAELQGNSIQKGRWFIRNQFLSRNLPRALVLYPTHDSNGVDYANVFQTFTAPGNYVDDTLPPAVNTLAIPTTQGAVDLTVAVALTNIDNNGRSVDLTIEAGGVVVGQAVASPTNGRLLNIVEVALEAVPAGTSQIDITLESAAGVGDSAALLGATARYACEIDNP